MPSSVFAVVVALVVWLAAFAAAAGENDHVLDMVGTVSRSNVIFTERVRVSASVTSLNLQDVILEQGMIVDPRPHESSSDAWGLSISLTKSTVRGLINSTAPFAGVRWSLSETTVEDFIFDSVRHPDLRRQVTTNELSVRIFDLTFRSLFINVEGYRATPANPEGDLHTSGFRLLQAQVMKLSHNVSVRFADTRIVSFRNSQEAVSLVSLAPDPLPARGTPSGWFTVANIETMILAEAAGNAGLVRLTDADGLVFDITNMTVREQLAGDGGNVTRATVRRFAGAAGNAAPAGGPHHRSVDPGATLGPAEVSVFNTHMLHVDVTAPPRFLMSQCTVTALPNRFTVATVAAVGTSTQALPRLELTAVGGLAVDGGSSVVGPSSVHPSLVLQLPTAGFVELDNVTASALNISVHSCRAGVLVKKSRLGELRYASVNRSTAPLDEGSDSPFARAYFKAETTSIAKFAAEVVDVFGVALTNQASLLALEETAVEESAITVRGAYLYTTGSTLVSITNCRSATIDPSRHHIRISDSVVDVLSTAAGAYFAASCAGLSVDMSNVTLRAGGASRMSMTPFAFIDRATWATPADYGSTQSVLNSAGGKMGHSFTLRVTQANVSRLSVGVSHGSGGITVDGCTIDSPGAPVTISPLPIAGDEVPMPSVRRRQGWPASAGFPELAVDLSHTQIVGGTVLDLDWGNAWPRGVRHVLAALNRVRQEMALDPPVASEPTSAVTLRTTSNGPSATGQSGIPSAVVAAVRVQLTFPSPVFISMLSAVLHDCAMELRGWAPLPNVIPAPRLFVDKTSFSGCTITAADMFVQIAQQPRENFITVHSSEFHNNTHLRVTNVTGASGGTTGKILELRHVKQYDSSAVEIAHVHLNTSDFASQWLSIDCLPCRFRIRNSSLRSASSLLLDPHLRAVGLTEVARVDYAYARNGSVIKSTQATFSADLHISDAIIDGPFVVPTSKSVRLSDISAWSSSPRSLSASNDAAPEPPCWLVVSEHMIISRVSHNGTVELHTRPTADYTRSAVSQAIEISNDDQPGVLLRNLTLVVMRHDPSTGLRLLGGPRVAVMATNATDFSWKLDFQLLTLQRVVGSSVDLVASSRWPTPVDVDRLELHGPAVSTIAIFRGCSQLRIIQEFSKIRAGLHAAIVDRPAGCPDASADVLKVHRHPAAGSAMILDGGEFDMDRNAAIAIGTAGAPVPESPGRACIVNGAQILAERATVAQRAVLVGQRVPVVMSGGSRVTFGARSDSSEFGCQLVMHNQSALRFDAAAAAITPELRPVSFAVGCAKVSVDTASSEIGVPVLVPWLGKQREDVQLNLCDLVQSDGQSRTTLDAVFSPGPPSGSSVADSASPAEASAAPCALASNASDHVAACLAASQTVRSRVAELLAIAGGVRGACDVPQEQEAEVPRPPRQGTASRTSSHDLTRTATPQAFATTATKVPYRHSLPASLSHSTVQPPSPPPPPASPTSRSKSPVVFTTITNVVPRAASSAAMAPAESTTPTTTQQIAAGAAGAGGRLIPADAHVVPAEVAGPSVAASTAVYAFLSPSGTSKPATVRRLSGPVSACAFGEPDVEGFPSRFQLFPLWFRIGPAGESDQDTEVADSTSDAAGAAVVTAAVCAAALAVAVLHGRWGTDRSLTVRPVAPETAHTECQVSAGIAASRDDANGDESSSLGVAAMAALVVMSSSYLAPSVAEAAVFAAASPSADPLQRTAGWAALLVCTALVAFVTATTVPVDASSVHKLLPNPLPPALSTLVEGLMDSSVSRQRAAYAADCATAVVIAACAGAARTGGTTACLVGPVVSAVAASVLFVYMALVRPFLDRVELWVSVGLSALQAALAVTTCVVVLTWSGDAVSETRIETVERFAGYYEIVTLAAPVVLAAAAIAHRMRATKTATKDRAADADDRQQPLLLLVPGEAAAVKPHSVVQSGGRSGSSQAPGSNSDGGAAADDQPRQSNPLARTNGGAAP